MTQILHDQLNKVPVKLVPQQKPCFIINYDMKTRKLFHGHFFENR